MRAPLVIAYVPSSLAQAGRRCRRFTPAFIFFDSLVWLALHQANGLLDSTVKVGVVAELGHLNLRHGNAGKGPFVAREGQRHLRTQGIDELGMARDTTCDHKDLGVEHGLQVDELSVK